MTILKPDELQKIQDKFKDSNYKEKEIILDLLDTIKHLLDGNNMNLYIVDFEYCNVNKEETIQDRWILAYEDDSVLARTMELNAKEFEKCGYRMNNYTYRKLNVTDNEYKINVEVQ